MTEAHPQQQEEEAAPSRDERRQERGRRRRRGLVAVVVVVALGCCGVYTVSRALEPEELTLVRERCTECHSLGRAISGERDRDGWESLIFRMQGYGAELTNEERELLVDYLAERSGG
jgi:hypothetical protein